MTTPIESAHRAGTRSVSGIRHPKWGRRGLVIATAVLVILLALATSGLAALAGFATAITVIAAAVISWEHVVVDARSAGLVGNEDPPAASAHRR